VVVSYWKLGQGNALGAEDHFDTCALLEQGQASLYRLRGESHLTGTQEDWIMQFERALQIPPHHEGLDVCRPVAAPGYTEWSPGSIGGRGWFGLSSRGGCL
jgi:hypothetical protein